MDESYARHPCQAQPALNSDTPAGSGPASKHRAIEKLPGNPEAVGTTQLFVPRTIPPDFEKCSRHLFKADGYFSSGNYMRSIREESLQSQNNNLSTIYQQANEVCKSDVTGHDFSACSLPFVDIAWTKRLLCLAEKCHERLT